MFVCLKPVEEETLILQKEEVESVCWMEVSQVLASARGDAGFCLFADEVAMVKEYLEKEIGALCEHG